MLFGTSPISAHLFLDVLTASGKSGGLGSKIIITAKGQAIDDKVDEVNCDACSSGITSTTGQQPGGCLAPVELVSFCVVGPAPAPGPTIQEETKGYDGSSIKAEGELTGGGAKGLYGNCLSVLPNLCLATASLLPSYYVPLELNGSLVFLNPWAAAFITAVYTIIALALIGVIILFKRLAR